jgi:hypothetical protein
VESILFGSWAEKLVYAALSLDGMGLSSYGLVSMTLKEVCIRNRTSLLSENSFTFVSRHNVSKSSPAPLGHRATWDERKELAVAKLAGRLTPAVGRRDYAGLVLFSEGDRSTDDFIEIHIYGGFNKYAISALKAPESMPPNLSLPEEVDWLFLEVSRTREQWRHYERPRT